MGMGKSFFVCEGKIFLGITSKAETIREINVV